MKLTFLGANHQVTGSCTLLEWKPGKFLLVDCGMEQGVNPYQSSPIPVAPGSIDYVLLTHAHIDHSGSLPLLYKNGFRGTIYATGETMNLCSIMLTDSAHIQETDAAYQTKKNLRTGLPPVEPEYTVEDAQNVLKLFRPCTYNEYIMFDEGLSIRFSDAGHLLGSSFIECFLTDGNEKRTVVFSGDVGNLNQPILNDPVHVSSADYLLIESTYGNRNHDPVSDPVPFLTETLESTFHRGGTVIIPSFAVGRTQELLYFFREIKQNHLIDPQYINFPVYVDSPMANEATAIFLQCDQSCLDEETLSVMRSGENPIWFEGLNPVVSPEESKLLNINPEPKVIIASGGMCEGGRIRHHLKHNLWNEKNTILFVGYQANGTLGRLIFDGAKTVKILGEEVDVKAETKLLSGISGHADQKGLINWINGFNEKPEHIFINHGDDDSCKALSDLIQKQFQIPSDAPYSGSVYDLVKGEWIRLTDPVFKKNTSVSASGEKETGKTKKDKAYQSLLNALSDLNDYVKGLKEHSNRELQNLEKEIRGLIS